MKRNIWVRRNINCESDTCGICLHISTASKFSSDIPTAYCTLLHMVLKTEEKGEKIYRDTQCINGEILYNKHLTTAKP